MAEQMVIRCPKCGHKIPVTKALTAHIETQLRRDFEVQAKAREKAAQEVYAKKLAAERAKLQERARKEAERSVSVEVARLQQEARNKERLVQQLRAKEKDVDKRNARKVEAARRIAEREMAARMEREHHVRDLQYQKANADLRKQVGQLKRKLEQASPQTQGKVSELELEEVLRKCFPDDRIEPVRTGRLGADVIHEILSANGQFCGTIVWESKNTKTWNDGWLAKIKSDQRRMKAEVAVIVSTTLPKELSSEFGQIQGVWVTSFPLVPGVAAALRANLTDMARMKLSAKGRTHMEALYNYLLSTEFRHRVEAIVEAFVAMKDDLHKERQTIERYWAKREKHIGLVFQSISGMIGDIQAVAPAFPKIRRLELPGPKDND
jgi:hypothetical protein